MVVGNLKGGSGKSTVAFNLAVWLTAKGHAVRLVDLDPQKTLSDLVAVRREIGIEPELMAPANAAHGLLGWALLALTLGHVAMALAHAYLWREDTLTRMLRGRPASIGGAK